MVFRYEGINWEGRSWQTVPAITTLGRQIEQVRPGPPTYPVDGTVASRRHDQMSPTSDHRPDADGDVHAIDFGGPTGWIAETVEAIRVSEDVRLRYVIFDGRMYSVYPKSGYDPFEWRPYLGPSPHRTHAHLSVRRDPEFANIDDPWILEEDLPQFTEEEAEQLRNLVAGLTAKDSSGWGFATNGVELIRKERRFPLHPNDGPGEEVLRRGDIVQLGNPASD